MLKTLILTLMAGMIMTSVSEAQMVSVGKKQTNARVAFNKEELQKTEEVRESGFSTVDGAKETGAEDSVVEDIPPPPTTVTPEEVIEIETESKKTISRSLKNKNDNDKKRMLGVMNWSEKKLKVHELMRAGMSYEDAKKAVEGSIQLPKMDIKKNEDIEKYIYEKGNFITGRTSNEK